MTIKKYYSTVDYCTSCGPKRIRFSRSFTLNGILYKGYYETSDPKEQKAIESDYFFGTYIFVDSIREIQDDQAVEHVDANRTVVVESVTTQEEAARYLIDTFGIEESKVSSITKIRNRMKEHNVEFPNLDK